jgi:hypothetical protein
MRPVNQWDQEYLEELVREKLKESQSLEYKDSRALGRDSAQTAELCKDVSAFANSGGGIVVYGIREEENEPKEVDEGADGTKITKEWIENILTTGILQKIEDLEIKPIDLLDKGTGRVAFVIRVGEATTRAPHQNVSDRKYYRRYNFKSEAMLDYEIRDAMRRSISYGRKFGIAWNLQVELRRLKAAAAERQKMPNNFWPPRSQLVIGISNDLRSSGEALILLSKRDRKAVAELINELDAYNSIIETVDPMQHERARLTDPLKRRLFEIEKRAEDISRALEIVLDEHQ